MNTTVITEPAPDIAVIIPHYNDVERLERCLTALMQNDIAGAEVLVIDNNSPDPPDRLHDLFPKVRFLNELEKGAGPARNRGVAASRAPFLAFIDADCVPGHDWLATARRVAKRADLIGGRVDVFDETPPPRSGAQAFEKVFAFNFKRYIEVQGISGAGNLVTSRAVFDDVGPFRTVVSEDTDWTRRAVAKGYRLEYADDLVASHPSRADWPALRSKWRRLMQESFALALTTHPAPMARIRWGLKALAMPASALVHLPKILASPKLDSFGERLRGALTLVHLRTLRMVWMLRQALGRAI
ncbi:glycosyltransferase family 2 protein [Marimonas arenosa]|uniref:Glycosyltransferase n=1 Tax=Marimonas arenosa TaxID=1795305 RepID=A0AAE4B4R6_9RHOB|nr:glycosyltransferase [Marimonas arenosa]MDQ2089659.1 glycosyltransferase [Marimonas arenosa]